MSKRECRLGEDTCGQLRHSLFADSWHRDTPPPRPARSRSNTAHGYADRFNPVEEEPAQKYLALPFQSCQLAFAPLVPPPRAHRHETMPYAVPKPQLRPMKAMENRDDSPARRLARVPTDSSHNIY